MHIVIRYKNEWQVSTLNNEYCTWIIVIMTGIVAAMMTSRTCAPTIIRDNGVFNRTENKNKKKYHIIKSRQNRLQLKAY